MESSLYADSIGFNIKAHDSVARKYEKIHGEIYNDVEQGRLKESLQLALSFITGPGREPTALDFGCGAGNLTRHLSSLGCKVIACDVSRNFLNLVASRQYEREVTTLLLNGRDLSNLPDASVDMVAAYSVLHHVPDYLSAIREFLRVLKPGGILYIDHEHSDDVWEKKDHYRAFEQEMKRTGTPDYAKYLQPENYLDWLVRRFINPRYRREGDIHVFHDDHIEWRKVTDLIAGSGGEVLIEKDYLLFKRNYDPILYERYKKLLTDMHLLVARKRQP